MATSWENRAAPALSVYSSIAQSVERMTVNHDVAGSSPAWGARNRKLVDDVSTGFFVVLCGRSVLESPVKYDNFCVCFFVH